MLTDKLEDDTTIDSGKERDEIRRYLSLLWQWAWLIVLLGVISAGSAFLISRQQMPVYETSTKVLVIAAPALQTTGYNL